MLLACWFPLVDSPAVATRLLPIGNTPTTESQARPLTRLDLAPIGVTPATESQARPLTKLEPPRQIQAWNAATEKAATLR